MIARAATFAAVFAALYAAHMVADYWVQTQAQATAKAWPGWRGRRACLAHVGTYTLTAILALLALVWRTHLYLDPVRPWIGLGVSAGSHYLLDRRWLLAWAARVTHRDPVWLERGGAAAQDQAAHVGFLFLAALVIC